MGGWLDVGDPAPLFTARDPAGEEVALSSVAGRYVVLSFVGSPATPAAARLLRAVGGGFGAPLYPIVTDRTGPVHGTRALADFDGRIAAAYGAKGAPVSYVLAPDLRVLARLPLTDGSEHARILAGVVAGLEPLTPLGVTTPGAPVLLVPGVFEPDLCRTLIDYYDRVGGAETGVLRSLADGRTVDVLDPATKRRRDAVVEDPVLRAAVRGRIERRLVPRLRKAFQFRATRIERYLVARYDAEHGGHFRAHRDNTTKATAHRRFAVTINLDADAYDGGELRFPEYDRHRYHAPTGAALVFSCSLLHEVLPVTRGARYCCLPFLYDEDGALIREQNAD